MQIAFNETISIRFSETKYQFFSMAAAGYEKFVSRSEAKSVEHFIELEKMFYEICPPNATLLNAHLDSAFIRLMMIFGDELLATRNESGYDQAFHLIIRRRREYKLCLAKLVSHS